MAAQRKEREVQTEHLAMRLTRSLLDQIDEEASEMRKERPGMVVARNDAVRVLLHEAIAARQAARARRRRAS
jgi:hypothetical protein